VLGKTSLPQSCVFVGGVVSGNVAVKGGRFQVSNAAVGGNVEIDGASTFALGPSGIHSNGWAGGPGYRETAVRQIQRGRGGIQHSVGSG
jgi:hypothetical protein